MTHERYATTHHGPGADRVPEKSIRRARRRGAALVRRLLRHLQPRQCRRHRPGAPGDLHKLWRARHPKNYHLEYGYSCMGYEIAGGLGIKMAAPEREVYVMVGDGSYLMMNSEIVTSIQEDKKLIVVLLDNSGFKSIGSLSRSLGQQGFGTRYIYPQNGILPGDDAEEVAL